MDVFHRAVDLRHHVTTLLSSSSQLTIGTAFLTIESQSLEFSHVRLLIR